MVRYWRVHAHWHVPCSIRGQFESYLTPQRKWRGFLLDNPACAPGGESKDSPSSLSYTLSDDSDAHDDLRGRGVVRNKFSICCRLCCLPRCWPAGRPSLRSRCVGKVVVFCLLLLIVMSHLFAYVFALGAMRLFPV